MIGYSSAVLLLIFISRVESQGLACSLPPNYLNASWYLTLSSYWMYSYDQSSTPAKTNADFYVLPSMSRIASICTDSNETGNAVYFMNKLFLTSDRPTCNRAVITNSAGALLLTSVTVQGAAGISDCFPAFSDTCFSTSQCGTKWLAKGTGNPGDFSSAASTCPFAPGTYGLTMTMNSMDQQCDGVVNVTGTRIIISPCQPAFPGTTTATAAIIYSGTTLTCSGNLPASAMIPSASNSSPSLLLLVARNGGQTAAMYCARYTPMAQGVNLTLDVTCQGCQTTNNQPAACGTYSNGANQFLSLTLGPVFSKTTAAAVTSVASSAAVSTTSSSVVSSTTSSSSSTSTTATPNQCAAVTCPYGQRCVVIGNLSAQCQCLTGSSPVNGTCSVAADQNVVKGVLIGLLAGSGALAALAGLFLLLGGSAATAANGPGAAAAAAAAAIGLSASKARSAYSGVNNVELTDYSGTSYPNGKKMTLRSTPAYASLPNNTYITVNSTIPSI